MSPEIRHRLYLTIRGAAILLAIGFTATSPLVFDDKEPQRHQEQGRVAYYVDPNGETVEASADQADALAPLGYTPATPEQAAAFRGADARALDARKREWAMWRVLAPMAWIVVGLLPLAGIVAARRWWGWLTR